MDLHGLGKKEAVGVVKSHLITIKNNLSSGNIEANYHPYQVVKVIAGAGSHTEGGKENAVLKGAVRDYLTEASYDFWSDFDNGVFLVKITKG